MSTFKVLCPIDFSEASYQALDQAIMLCQSNLVASPGKSRELHLLYVVAPAQPAIPLVQAYPFGAPQPLMSTVQFFDSTYAQIAAIEQEARRDAEEKLRSLVASRVPSAVSTQMMTRYGDCGLEILRAAESGHYNLIVMGTHGETGWRHLILGSVTEEVVRLAPCPVVTICSRKIDVDKQPAAIERPDKTERILCTTDFSEPSFQGLEIAADLAAQCEATLLVLHVIEPLAPPFGTVPQTEFDESRSNDASHMLLDVIKEHVTKEERGYVRCRRLVRIGKVAEEIVHAAAEEKIDLLVIATQGETGWRHLAFGSVAEDVVRTAPCPVLSVRPIQQRVTEDAQPADVQHADVQHADAESKATSEESKAGTPPQRPVTSAFNPQQGYSQHEFPQEASSAEKLTYLLNYAVLAPSSHNTQPWLWKLNGDTVELYADRSRALPIIDPEGRELIMSCGAALFFLRLAMRHFGYADDVHVFPDANNPDLLATVQLGAPQAELNETYLLFRAIFRRHTDRTLFDDRRLTTSMRQRLKEAAHSEGARLHFIESVNRDVVIRLIEKGQIELGHDKWYRHELSGWMRSNNDTRKDGIPGYALGLSDIASHLAPSVVRSFDIGSRQARKERILAENAPVLATLETETDTPADWLLAGQALARVLLRACSGGVYASFLNAPVEVNGLWPHLRQTLELQGFPQLLFRLGYASDAESHKATPRRPIDEVLIRTDASQNAKGTATV